MNRSFNTQKIVRISLFAAICFFGTWIHIPIDVGGGTSMIHLGTTAIFLSAIFLGADAGWAGAIGCALFDATNPMFAAWILPTFITKGLTGYITGKIAFSKGANGNRVLLNIIGFVAGGIVSLLGYFIINWFFFVGFYGAIVKMSTSIITTIIAILITIPLMIVKPLVNKALNYNQ